MLQELTLFSLAPYLISGLLSAVVARRAPEKIRYFLPGAIFGIAHSVMHLDATGRILVHVALCAAAYYAAICVAGVIETRARKIRIFRKIPTIIAGLAAGSLGALCVAFSIEILGDVGLNVLDYGRTIAVGGFCGAIFLIMAGWGGFKLGRAPLVGWIALIIAFSLWQLAVGVSIDLAASSNASIDAVAKKWITFTSSQTMPPIVSVVLVIAFTCFLLLVRVDEKFYADSASGYRDLPSALTRHSWLALLYALTSVILIYALGFWTSASLLFFVFLAPTLAAAVYVVSSNQVVRIRLVLIWVITALIAWSYTAASMMKGASWAVDVLSLTLICLVVYWLLRAISASKAEFGENKSNEDTATAIAWLLSAWGATLQLAFVMLLFIKYLLQDVLLHSSLGLGLVWVLKAIRLSSPVMWFPFGVFAAGMIFYAVVLFADFPYSATDFKEVLPAKLPPIINEVIAAIRIPVWLIVIIVGFLVHFVFLLGQALLEFGEKWIGRFVLLVTVLVAPALSLLLGNLAFLYAMSLVSRSLSGGPGNLLSSLSVFVLVHCFILLALFLYVISVAPIGGNVFPISIKVVPALLKEHFVRDGFPAAQATGKAFALYGIVFLAVPLASLLPGGAEWGIFSTCYTAMVAIVAMFYLLGRRFLRYQKKSTDAEEVHGSPEMAPNTAPAADGRGRC